LWVSMKNFIFRIVFLHASVSAVRAERLYAAKRAHHPEQLLHRMIEAGLIIAMKIDPRVGLSFLAMGDDVTLMRKR